MFGGVKKALRTHWLKTSLKDLGTGTIVEENVFFQDPGSISIGSNSNIRSYVQIHGSYKGKGAVTFGPKCWIGEFSMIVSFGGVIEFGQECSLNPFCVIYGHGGLKIGNRVRIATHSVIIPANHHFASKSLPISQQGLSRRGIIIEDDVWIGSGVTITDGVKIGEGAVVGAGAVVTHDIPSYEIWAGVPAHQIGAR